MSDLENKFKKKTNRVNSIILRNEINDKNNALLYGA
jgi:hypothetical protein